MRGLLGGPVARALREGLGILTLLRCVVWLVITWCKDSTGPQHSHCGGLTGDWSLLSTQLYHSRNALLLNTLNFGRRVVTRQFLQIKSWHLGKESD